MTWHPPAGIVDATKQALKIAGEALLDDAAARAPVLSGDLVESGYAEIQDDDSVRIGFSEPYAVKQHYAKKFRHPGGGGAMYLYDAVGDFGDEFERIAAEEFRRILGGS